MYDNGRVIPKKRRLKEKLGDAMEVSEGCESVLCGDYEEFHASYPGLRSNSSSHHQLIIPTDQFGR